MRLVILLIENNQLMRANQFELKLLRMCEEFFNAHSYKLILEKKQFRRITVAGFHSIIFNANAIANEWWIEVHLGVRSQLIEELAQQFLELPLDYRSEATTWITSIGKLSGEPYFRYKVKTENDLKEMVQSVQDFMLQKGFPFIAKHTHVSSISQLLNDFPTKNCPYIYNQIHRCFKGLIAAHYTHKELNLPYLEDTYRAFIVKNGLPKDQLAFEKLCSFLPVYQLN